MVRERQRGKVKWYDIKKGIGFIQREGRPDVFVHFSQVISADRRLTKGEELEFNVVKGTKGPAAVDVIRV